MSENPAILKAWLNGIVTSWYCRDSQLPAVKLIYDERFPFLECTRRFGKTTLILTTMFEFLIKYPGFIVRWCAPWKNQAREIVMPEVDKIQSHIPEAHRFKWSATDSFYHYSNKSRLYLRGINDDKGESARGSFAHAIVADEYGSWRHAEYVRKDVLNPQLLTTKGKFIYASTPPKNLGHSYYKHIVEAKKKNRFFQAVIYDNESLTELDIQEAMEEAGGEESSTWRREYLCEHVADSEQLVVPEFDEKVHVCEFERPQYFDAYTGADTGFNDKTGVLFCYLDFVNATICVEDELLLQSENSETVSKEIKKKEAECWGHAPYMRVADSTNQQLYDLVSQHGLSFIKPRKDDRFAAINSARLLFQNNRIKIHPRCKALIQQLKVGMWNERRTDFERGEGLGHLDLFMALVYLNRMINWTKNPIPKLQPGVNYTTHLITVDDTPDDIQALKQIFGGRRK